MTIDELITGVNIALEAASLARCPSFDSDGDGFVTIDEILQGVEVSLGECSR